MISSARSRVRAPRASAVSASASRWRPPVRSAPNASAIAAATSGDRCGASATATPPTAAPTPAPTSGNATPERATSSPPTAIRRPSGSRVWKVIAAATARSSSTARIAHPCRLERGHLAEDGQARGHDRQRERRAAPFPEAEAEVEQRVESQLREDRRMARLRRPVRRDQRARRGGCEPDGDERRRARDEAVEQDGKAIRGGAQHEAGKHRDLEPADRGEDAERVGGIRRLQRERTPDRLDLARESVVV